MDVVHRGQHVVGFYETDDFLTGLVADFFTSAVSDGGHALAIATGAHRLGIGRALAGELPTGESGQLVMDDAERTLASLMTDGALDPDRFRAVVSELIEGLASDGKPVRIFGEMVALLYTRGEREAAFALEDMWNDLSSRYEFDLLCAYPMRDFGTSESTAGFLGVCGRHTAVTNEGYAGLASDADHLHVLVLDRPITVQPH